MTVLRPLPFILFFLGTVEFCFSQIPTNRNIYDFEIGDVFYYESGDHSYQQKRSTYLSYSRYTVLQRNLNTNGDSLFYEIYRDSVVYKWNNTTLQRDTFYSKDTILVVYTELDSVPEVDTVFSDASLFNGRTQARDTFEAPDLLWKITYIEGCGKEFWRYPYTDYEYWRYLKYYKKGNEEWGNKYVGVEENRSFSKQFRIYPNPSNDILTIDLRADSRIEQIEIVDNAGKLVSLKQINSETSHQLDVSGLPNGLYFIRLRNAEGVQLKKFLISH